jgi:hypothetical protein
MDSKSPINDPPLRLPGQSIEEQRNKLLEEVVEQWVLVAGFSLVLACLEWYRFIVDMKPSPVFFTVGAVLACVFAGWRVRQVLPSLQKLRRARDGELAVGQYLDRVAGRGYRVFHDIIGGSFNIDHLLIGPAGVFTVETKTWSKPVKGRAEVHFDGERIKVLGRHPDRDPVIQAKAQANWIRKLLIESAGIETYVKPVVALPGWFVVQSNAAFKDVWVLEPKALPKFLENEPTRLSSDEIQLLAFHVSRYVRAEQRSG